MDRHTKGPWFCGEDADGEWYFTAASDPDTQIGWCCCQPESGQTEANAKLITAAPDMVHLIKFLAATWAEVDAWAHTLDADVLMRYPVVQGLRAQMALRKLGKGSVDLEAVNRALKLLSEQAIGDA